MALTLVPSTLAEAGHRFHFVGPNRGEECAGCPVQRLCFGLTPGRTYEVTGVRSVEHPCALHEGGKVRVVEAQEASFATSIERRRLRGTAATWTPVACGRPECPEYGFCHPVGPEADAPYEIEEAGEAMECPAGYDLQRVRLRHM